MNTRCTPAFANAVNLSANSAGGPIGRRSRSMSPDRWSEGLRGPGFQRKTLRRIETADERRTVFSPQRPERADRLIESWPTLREIETDCRVILTRRPRTDCHDQPTSRQTIDRAQRLGDGYRSTHHWERDRRCQRHLT